jgi:hypothetical protein
MGAPGHSGPNRLVMTVSSVSEATSRSCIPSVRRFPRSRRDAFPRIPRWLPRRKPLPGLAALDDDCVGIECDRRRRLDNAPDCDPHAASRFAKLGDPSLQRRVPEENGDRSALLGAHQDVIIGRCGTERRRFDDQIDGERPRGVPANLADQSSEDRFWSSLIIGVSLISRGRKFWSLVPPRPWPVPVLCRYTCGRQHVAHCCIPARKSQSVSEKVRKRF